MNGHPAVDVHRQVPRPLTLTQLTESRPVDGDRSREKNTKWFNPYSML